jgi:glycosyltransferase involved in cell wall biosynthesis
MVSVVIPTHNRAHTLPLALQSLQRQTLLHWECWVIDDHSTDNTSELLAHYQQKDSRFHPISLRKDQTGANAARNEGLRRATGDYVLFLDSDDALADFCLERRVEKMAAQPKLDFAVWPTLLFDQIPGDGRTLWNVFTEKEDLDRYLALDVPWQTAGVLWRRSALEKLGPWNEKLPSWQDWDYHVRALAHDLAYAKFREPDCYWRRPGPDSIGSLSLQKEHLEARLPLLNGIETLLRATGKLEERQRRLLGSLYLWHAQLLYIDSQRKFPGLTFWFQAWRRGLVPTRELTYAWKWFREKVRGSATSGDDFFSHWPPGYRVEKSPTLQCIPFGPEA